LGPEKEVSKSNSDVIRKKRIRRGGERGVGVWGEGGNRMN